MHYSQATIEELANLAVKKQDDEALITIILRNQEQYYRIAYAYLKEQQSTLDAIQELTYKALKSVHKVKNPQYLETWLVRVLIHTAIDMQRKNKKYVLHEPKEQAIYDNYEDISHIVASLTSEQQELLYLKYYYGLKNEEIATLQNIPEGTVKSRTHSILQKLRKTFVREGL